MRFGLLGPLEVLDRTGATVDVGGPQPRVVLALLLVADNRPVRADALVDAVWGESPPRSAVGTLQSYVSRMRRGFGEDAEASLDHVEGGYRLTVDHDAVDAWRFERMVASGRALLDGGDPAAASAVLLEAEALWRGPVLPDFTDLEDVRTLAIRLEERRVTAIEDRVTAELALGHHSAVIGELTALVEAHPLREGLRAQLALAFYRSGRQAEALRTIADGSRTLREELGIEPGRSLRDLEVRILDHDPSLDLPEADTAPRAAGGAPGGAPGEDGAPGTDDAPLAGTVEPARFVGRETEQRQLLAALEEAASDSRFVVLEGDPGIGKTRLADELRVQAESRGSQVLWGRSDEGGAAPALWPWLAPLRSLATTTDDLVPAIAGLLGGEVPISAGQGAHVRFELFEAIASVLEQAGSERPVVVLLDDLQWADDASLALLSFLASRLGRGVLVVVTVRRVEVGHHSTVTDALGELARRRGSRRILVRGLRSEATATMLASLDPGVAAAIHQRAEGNPFYAIELARLVDDQGRLPDDVPGSVGDVVRRRIGRLPAATADLLGVAAVVGREVDLGLLARTAGIDLGTCLDTIDPAVAQRLLEDDPDQLGGLRFSHALIRDVLLDGLTSLRRARLHLTVADAIIAGGAGRDDAEILAEHLWRAAPVGVGSRAADALEQAAEVAVSRVAYSAAEDLLLRAVRLRQGLGAGDAEKRAELDALVRLLEVTQITRYFQGADDAFVDRAVALALELGETETHRRLAWYQWSAYATAARVDEAAPLTAQFVAELEHDPDPVVRSSAHQVQGVWFWGAGRIGDAVRALDRAIDLLDGVPPPEDTFGAEKYLVTFTFWLYNHLLHGSISLDDAVRGYQELHDGVPDPVGRASVCGFAMTTFAPLFEWGQVEHFERLALEADPRSQFGFWGGQLLMHRGLLAAWKGRIDDAIELFDEGRSRYRGVGGCSGMHAFEASFSLLLAEHGHQDEARNAAQRSRGLIEAKNERWGETVTLLAEAEVAAGEDDVDDARRKLEEAVGVAHRQECWAMLAMIARTAVELDVSGIDTSLPPGVTVR